MAARSSLGLGLACFAVVVAAASATQFRVGGQKGWTVPDAGFEPYNTWAGRLRFQIGDQLLFVYPKETDSVLLVEPAAYNACNASSYVQKFDDGNTVFTFDRSGPFFFISGNEANCRANEKLIIVVLAPRTPPGAPAPTMSPPGAPAPTMSPPPSAAPLLPPAAAPATPPSGGGAAPMPAPAATPASPPSPAAPAPAATPGSPPAPMAPSPSGTPGGASQPPSAASAGAPGAAEGSSSTTPPPPPSAAAPVVAGFVGSLGAFIGYAMLAA